VVQLEAAQLQKSAKKILKNESSEIAYMGEVVRCGATGVHADFPSFLGDEGLNSCSEGIVDLDSVHLASVAPLGTTANE
jgi:hypothetical protein